MKNPPTEVYLVQTIRQAHEKHVYGPVRACRMYSSLAHARLFISHHKDRPYRLLRTSVEWEEIESGDPCP